MNGEEKDLKEHIDNITNTLFERHIVNLHIVTYQVFLNVCDELKIPKKIINDIYKEINKLKLLKILKITNTLKDISYENLNQLLSLYVVTEKDIKKYTNNTNTIKKLSKLLIIPDIGDIAAENDYEGYQNHEEFNHNLDEEILDEELGVENFETNIENSVDTVQEYFDVIGRYNLLNLKEEKELTLKIKEGDSKAIKKLMECNLRLVVSIAKKYKNKGMTLIDLIHDGNIGLYKSIHKFDPNKGFRFSTYAHWWIKQAITRSIAEKSSMIRMPVHLFELKNKINRFINNYVWNYGEKPDNKTIMTEFNISQKKLNNLLNIKTNCLSIDQHYNSEDMHNLSEIILDTQSKSPYENLIKKNALNTMHNLIQQLPKREAQIIQLRFGLDIDKNSTKIISKTKNTLDFIGKVINVTRERIRQLETQAIQKLQTIENIEDILPLDNTY